jgi:hypothetical protein
MSDNGRTRRIGRNVHAPVIDLVSVAQPVAHRYRDCPLRFRVANGDARRRTIAAKGGAQVRLSETRDTDACDTE